MSGYPHLAQRGPVRPWTSTDPFPPRRRGRSSRRCAHRHTGSRPAPIRSSARRLAAEPEPTGETEMSLTIDRDGTRMRAEDNTARRHGGPVVLATFDGAPLQDAAVRLAVESAADMRSSLLVVDAVAARARRRGPG